MPRTHRRFSTLALALTLAAGSAGCRAVVERVFTPPTVALRNVALTGLGLGGATLGVTLSVANPNPYPLAAARATYRLLVGADSVEVARGAATEPLEVAARDSTLITVPLDVSWTALGRAGRGAARGGAVDYRVVGEVVASTPLGERAFPVDTRGRFAALQPGR